MDAEEAAGRAIVLKSGFSLCRDVLCAEEVDYDCTDFPFAAGVYAWPRNKPYAKKEELPLLYVSKQVARDRSPVAHISNGGGVFPGWYVIARPGMAFEVRVFYNPDKNNNLINANGYKTTLIVDGQDTNTFIVYKRNEPESDEVYKGFLENRISGKENKARVTDNIRPFSFEKAQTSTHDNEISVSRKLGTIKLAVWTGTVHKLRPALKGNDVSFEIAQYGATEKVIAKEGRSLRVKSNSIKVPDRRILAPFGIRNEKTSSECGLIIYVREASWMRSRRLIDDQELPCTYKKFLSLRKEDNTFSDIDEVSDASDNPRQKKRRTVSSVVFDVDAGNYTMEGIVDLT